MKTSPDATINQIGQKYIYVQAGIDMPFNSLRQALDYAKSRAQAYQTTLQVKIDINDPIVGKINRIYTADPVPLEIVETINI